MMNKLYDIWDRERKRHPELTVSYNQNNNTLSYRNDEGRLTVFFNPKEIDDRGKRVGKPKEGCEEFRFYPEGDNNKIGILVYEIQGHGQYGSSNSNFDKLPENLRKLIADFQFDREAIGIENVPLDRLQKTLKGEIKPMKLEFDR